MNTIPAYFAYLSAAPTDEGPFKLDTWPSFDLLGEAMAAFFGIWIQVFGADSKLFIDSAGGPSSFKHSDLILPNSSTDSRTDESSIVQLAYNIKEARTTKAGKVVSKQVAGNHYDCFCLGAGLPSTAKRNLDAASAADAPHATSHSRSSVRDEAADALIIAPAVDKPVTAASNLADNEFLAALNSEVPAPGPDPGPGLAQPPARETIIGSSGSPLSGSPTAVLHVMGSHDSISQVDMSSSDPKKKLAFDTITEQVQDHKNSADDAVAVFSIQGIKAQVNAKVIEVSENVVKASAAKPSQTRKRSSQSSSSSSETQTLAPVTVEEQTEQILSQLSDVQQTIMTQMLANPEAMAAEFLRIMVIAQQQQRK